MFKLNKVLFILTGGVLTLIATLGVLYLINNVKFSEDIIQQKDENVKVEIENKRYECEKDLMDVWRCK